MSLDVSPGYPPPSAPPPPPPAPPSGPPPPVYPQYGYMPGGPSPVAKTSGRAVAALVLALVSIFVPFVLVPAVLLLGALALSQIAKTPFLRGKAMAISAIVITLASAVGWAALVTATDAPTGTGTAGRPAVENVVATVGRACRGQAVPEAGAYRGQGPFHLVLARDNGRPMPWSARNARWRAEEVADTELVACIAEQSNLIETCPYWNGPDISRYETVMTVRLVTARQGRPVTTFQITAQPRQCRSTEYMSTVRLDGVVTFQQLSQRLGLASLAPATG